MEKDIYNYVFKNGGYEGVYNLPYNKLAYFLLYKKILDEVKKRKKRNILEVGCGNGNLAQLNKVKYGFNYIGFNISSVGVQYANVGMHLIQVTTRCSVSNYEGRLPANIV